MTLRVLIVDDEPLARDLLRTMLNEHDVEIVAEARNGTEAIAALADRPVDLAFLDVQMPELDGFAVVERIGPERMPAVVFVTAYDQYAVRAFEIHAVDYLLKPFDADRVSTALARATARIQQVSLGDMSRRLNELVSHLRRGETGPDRIAIKAAGRIRFVPTRDLDWIEADGKHLKLHAGAEVHSIRETMNAMEARLDPGVFVRVHRSAIVNVRRVREVQPWFQGDYVLILATGARVTTGRAYRARVQKMIAGT